MALTRVPGKVLSIHCSRDCDCVVSGGVSMTTASPFRIYTSPLQPTRPKLADCSMPTCRNVFAERGTMERSSVIFSVCCAERKMQEIKLTNNNRNRNMKQNYMESRLPREQ